MSKYFNINDNYRITKFISMLSIIAIFFEIIMFFVHPVRFQQGFFLLLFTLITVMFLLMVRRSFMVIFLLSTFTLIASWRLSALAHYHIVTWILTIAMVFKLINYLLFAYESIQAKNGVSPFEHQITLFEWQLLFIRLFIGFDLIPHFCEKLFAGSAVRADDVHAFIQLGVHYPLTMVFIVGIMEFGGALALSCGLFTRLGSICLAIYMLTATYLGHHFSNGFIWASPGGGWEYPVLWTVLILSFALFGAGDFSIDRYLKDRFHLPQWIKHIMGGRCS